jgi:hypothetical protein
MMTVLRLVTPSVVSRCFVILSKYSMQSLMLHVADCPWRGSFWVGVLEDVLSLHQCHAPNLAALNRI